MARFDLRCPPFPPAERGDALDPRRARIRGATLDGLPRAQRVAERESDAHDLATVAAPISSAGRTVDVSKRAALRVHADALEAMRKTLAT